MYVAELLANASETVPGCETAEDSGAHRSLIGRARALRKGTALDDDSARSAPMRDVFTTLRRLAPTDVTVTLVGETGKALRSIVDKVGEIDMLVSEISASAQEQATGLNEVNTAVNQMDQIVQQNAAMVEESTAAAHSLKGETNELSNSVSRFARRRKAPS